MGALDLAVCNKNKILWNEVVGGNNIKNGHMSIFINIYRTT